ncbi:MAG: sodium-dependent transporter [Alphaproteobacteria bacterium]|nr:sodium-dependent transporter [Alphaproteobacteria bacterium]
MAVKPASEHAHWSSRWAFIMAAVGSAVGLGNIWKFPYEANSGGGGAFVLIYLGFVFLIGVPLLVAELSLGRRGQLSPIRSMEKVAKEEGRRTAWSLIGWSGVIGSFIVISYYSVVGGWTLSYMIQTVLGNLQGITGEEAVAGFDALVTNPWMPLVWHGLFMGITVGIVLRGIEGGLEKAVTLLMPALFILLIGMVIYAGVTGDFAAAVSFLFQPDWSKLDADVILSALGQSFFSLSLAQGSIMVYGSYLTRQVKVGKAAVTIAAADSGVALLAGLAIFPIVFAYGLTPGKEEGLVFQTLPIAFGQMTGGVVIGTLFFGLLTVAAITSAISLLEPSVSYLAETDKFGRKKAAFIMGGAAFAFGSFSSLGYGILSDVTIFGQSIIGFKTYLTNNLMMPMAGLFTALFVGWFVSRKAMMDELAMEEPWFRVWYFLVRFICPTAIAVIFYHVVIGF